MNFKRLALVFIILLLTALFFATKKFGVIDLIKKVGVVSEIEYISGTGSMYPTFPKGKGKTNLERASEIVSSHATIRYPGGIVLFGKRYRGYQLQRGDIVFFQNDKTQEIIEKESSSSSNLSAGFVKRIIALSGDKIEIRDGFVKLNDEIIFEPYIAQARSTYGGDLLPDCRPLLVPDGFIVVMGDNRKGSNDSRFALGLVKTSDIRTVIPTTEQDDLKNHWRDTTDDLKTANKPLFDASTYLKLLNQKRQEVGVKNLSYQKKLEESARKRTDVIIKYDDASYEATKSGYTMKKAMQDVGYNNIVWGEIPTIGYFQADELIENFFSFPDAKKFLLNGDFSETGISAGIGEINGCPVQVVVQHLAGYVPPNYDPKIIAGWKTLINNVNETISSWERAKNDSRVNQEDLNKLLNLLITRKNNAEKIYNRMEANQWLTKEEEELTKIDGSLYEQAKILADKLNKT